MDFKIPLRTDFDRFLAPTSNAPLGLGIMKAIGCKLISFDGKEYIDLISGISVSNLGHGNQAIREAVIQQVNLHSHLMVFGEFLQCTQVQLAKLLVSLLPESLSSVYFVNSGAEAVEGALKLAKRYTGRTGLISCHHAYHGSTHGALSVMGSEEYKNAYRPLLPDTQTIRFNHPEDLDKIDEHTAAIIIEPIQAEAGVVLPESGFLELVRKRCDAVGALMILDEIQTGMGRTGSLFAFEQFNFIPDVLLLAKAFGGGYPLGAFIASPDIMKCLSHDPMLGHITTFGGHPVSCAAGLASLTELSDNAIIQEVKQKSCYFANRLASLPEVKQFSAAGLLISLDLGSFEFNKAVIDLCLDQGLITDWFLFAPYKMRIAPPLIISREEIEIACDIIESSIKQISNHGK